MINTVAEILRFGGPYLRPYWVRLAAGILLGVLFGLSNASFMWATKTLFERMDAKPVAAVSTNGVAATGAVGTGFLLPASAAVAAQPAQADKATAPAKVKKSRKFGVWLNAFIDPWLPLQGRAIDWKQIVGGLLFLPILVALRGYLGYLSSYCMSWVSERVIKDLRLNLLLKLNTLSIDFFNRSTIGELLARVNGDTNSLYRCLSLGFSDLVKEPITVVGILAYLLSKDPLLTGLAVVFTPLTVIPIRILGKKARKAVTANLGEGISQDSLLVEVYSSIRIVKAFCLEGRQIDRFRKIYQRLVHIGMKNVQAKELINPIIEVISMVGLGFVIIVIFFTHKTVPALVEFLTGVLMMYSPIKKLAGLHIYFQQASVGATRLIEIFKENPTVVEKPNPIRLTDFKGRLSFENVSFSYDGNQMVVQDVKLDLPRGIKLGVAGPSGSGKSTFISLILRFYDPVKGCLKIDGLDFRDVALGDLRRQMALVSQDVVIFDQTIAENIACGKEGATMEEVIAAAKSAFAHDFIMEKPGGYQSRVGERGVTLSGGQKQRIAIARAFVRNAPILVLDEATASLDAQAEAEVQAALDRLSENRTVICIAHRLSTLRNYDKIIVFYQGKITETGTFDELLRNQWTFAWMANQQGITLPQNG